VLIDELLPSYDASERHHTVVEAPIERVYPFVRTLDLRRSFLSRLFRVWERSARRVSPRLRRDGGLDLSLQSFLDYGFVLLADRPPEEVVIGLTERVGMGERVRRVGPQEFATFVEPGFAKAVWNFSLVPLGPGRTRLTTETRVLCLDPRSRRRFMVYWLVIRFFSGLIRREFLRAIKKAAESPGEAPPAR
jgi:hypothetical protein